LPLSKICYIITLMKKPTFSKNIKNADEQTAWLRLTPAKRIQETTKLWQLYRALGGKLGPKPDPQSPFHF